MTATSTAPIEITADLLTNWATDPAGPVALHLKQKLLPVTANDGEEGIIYPPTYADIGYSIDTLADGRGVALIDSVGSQANRMEPIFKEKFSTATNSTPQSLVPQIEIALRPEKAKDQPKAKNQERAADEQKTAERPYQETRSLLDLAHRSADAVVQSCPNLKTLFDPAFEALRRGNAGPLTRCPMFVPLTGSWRT